MSEPVVAEIVSVEQLPLGSKGSRRLVARWSDGTVSEALRWYADEWLVSEGDVIGKTRAEIRSLGHARDRDWLMAPVDDDVTPFFRT